jgi:4-alpha-glucanotransferase
MLQNTTRVDHAAVMRAKRAALERMAKRFRKDDAFFDWAKQGAFGYAHFRAAKEELESTNEELLTVKRELDELEEKLGV